MAAPVISGTVPASPIVFAPGQEIDILVQASDPDNSSPVAQVFHVTDQAGNVSSISVTLQVQDALSYSADPAPAGWSIVQDGANPALFHVTAP